VRRDLLGGRYTTFEDRTLMINCWALLPLRNLHDAVFTANGRPFDEQRFPFERGDLADASLQMLCRSPARSRRIVVAA
jgi:hypothetical protein